MEDKKDVYQIITDKVIEGVKNKGLSWFKTWNGQDSVPMSYTTKKPYRGINYLMLAYEMDSKGYTNNEFITINQAKKFGGQIIKGSKSSMVVFYNVSFRDTDGKYYKNERALIKAGKSKNDDDIQMYFTPRYYNVFNVECFEGLPISDIQKKREALEGTIFQSIPEADDVWNGYKNNPTLSHGGDRAYYRPSTDSIKMPKRQTFNTPNDYYGVLWHEMIHSTGHESRIGRKEVMETNMFGSNDYSKEELVAELGSMFLQGITGVECDTDNSQAYINGWLERLENNPKWIISASSQSQRAVEHILGK